MDFFWTYLAPTLGVMITVIAPVLAGLGAAALTKLFSKLGLDIEAKNREAFQTAITNAAIMAATKMGGPLAASTVSRDILEDAVSMVQKSVPDAVKKFDAQPKDIEKRIQSQAELILQQAETVVSDYLVPAIKVGSLISRIAK